MGMKLDRRASIAKLLHSIEPAFGNWKGEERRSDVFAGDQGEGLSLMGGGFFVVRIL